MVGNAAVLIPDRVSLVCFCANIAFKQTTAFSSTSSPAMFMDSGFSKLWLGPTSSCKSPYKTCSALCNKHSRMHPVSPTPAPTTLRSLLHLPDTDSASKIWTILFLISTLLPFVEGLGRETQNKVVSTTDLVPSQHSPIQPEPFSQVPSVLVLDRPSSNRSFPEWCRTRCWTEVHED